MILLTVMQGYNIGIHQQFCKVTKFRDFNGIKDFLCKSSRLEKICNKGVFKDFAFRTLFSQKTSGRLLLQKILV